MITRKWLTTGVASMLVLSLVMGSACRAGSTTTTSMTTTTPPTTTTPTPTPSPTPTSTPTPTQAFNEVAAWDNYFSPQAITVPVGTTVTWTNVGVEPHTVTTYTDLFNSDLALGESFSYTFNEPGTYSYFCVPHEAEDMLGEVIVE